MSPTQLCQGARVSSPSATTTDAQSNSTGQVLAYGDAEDHKCSSMMLTNQLLKSSPGVVSCSGRRLKMELVLSAPFSSSFVNCLSPSAESEITRRRRVPRFSLSYPLLHPHKENIAPSLQLYFVTHFRFACDFINNNANASVRTDTVILCDRIISSWLWTEDVVLQSPASLFNRLSRCGAQSRYIGFCCSQSS